MKRTIPAGALALGLMWGGAALATEAEDPGVPLVAATQAETGAAASAPQSSQVDPCDPRLMEGDVNEVDIDEFTQVNVREAEPEKGGVNTGVYFLAGGGVDGYTGGLNHDLKVGPSWGAMVGVTSKYLGLEAAYSGAANNIDTRSGVSAGSGVDVVRQGGQAAATLNLTGTALHPFLMGGIGIEHRDFRNGERLGFSNDTNGYIPAGAGLRWNVGVFTADARVTYNFMFDDDFAPGNPTGDRYQGTLTLGGTL